MRLRGDRPGRRPTFRARLTLNLVILSLTVLAAGCLIVYGAVRRTLSADLDGALYRIARAEIASAVDAPGGQIHVHDEGPLLLSLTARSFYEKYAQIEDASGQLVAQTANLRKRPLEWTDPRLKRRALGGHPEIADLRYGRSVLRAIYYPVHDGVHRPCVAVIAIPREPMDRSLNALALTLLFALLLVGAGAAAVANRLARRLTRPLEEIAAAALRVDHQDLRGRIPHASRDAELADVTCVLNDMLERLEQAFERQQQLIRVQQRFVADASHELRSPLSNLRGAVEVTLRRPRSADDYREALETAQREIERLCRLVNDLLTLSRADAQRLVVDRVPCDLGEVARASVRAHAARARERAIDLQLHADPAPITGDPDRLRQVVDNLVDNALRYAPPESSVVVQVEREAGETRLSVSDTGPGISPADQAHLFDRFYRADTSRSRHSGGLGLGLSIARAIMEAHHGSITVESAPGAGCTFSIHLPRQREAAAKPSDDAPISALPGPQIESQA